MNEIRRNLEMRRENLAYLLKNKSAEIELEKQHQIYGAIKEIDNVLQMMVVTSDEQETIIAQAPERVGVLKKIGERVKTFKSPIKIRFENNEL